METYQIILIALAALAGGAILWIAGTVYVFLSAMRRVKKPLPPISELPSSRPFADRMRADVKAGEALPHEEFSITSYDGLRLCARYIPAPGGQARATVLLEHGYRGRAIADFACVFSYYRSRGYALLIPDQRAHGKSEGKYITLGLRERFDCRDWANLLSEKFPGRPIILDGVSMGCSTVLMASELELPPEVKLIVADCGFTSPYAITDHVLSEYMHIPRLLHPPMLAIASLVSRRIAGYGLREVSTVDALAKNRIPVLFAHGDADRFVPPEMTRQNFAACKAPCELLISPGARHGMSFLVSEEEYAVLISKMLDRYVG